jgi:hypothetical protein
MEESIPTGRYKGVTSNIVCCPLSIPEFNELAESQMRMMI